MSERRTLPRHWPTLMMSERTRHGNVQLYLRRQADGAGRYVLEQLIQAGCGWVPTLVGIGLRAVLYRAILKMDGMAAIEAGMRLRFANRIRLGDGAYLDQGVYIHACPGGVAIGPRTLVMHGSILHVYNFRDLPHAGITIGADSLIGEMNVIRGQGGVTIGDRVYTSPLVQIVAVNHVFDDPDVPSSTRASPPKASSSKTMSGSAPAPSSPTASASARARSWRPGPS